MITQETDRYHINMKIVKAMRIDQWLKNLLIFVPFFSYGNFDLAQGLDLVRVFFGFSLIVSSTYILNDLVDLSSDREHPSKKLRPVASGVYKTNVWVAILSICLLLGKVILFLTNVQTLIYSTLYLAITIIYTFKLKYIKFLDILTVALLFTLRVLLGGTPFSIKLSVPLILFVVFISLGVVSGKKISIMNNEKIKNSKIKNFLTESYSSEELTTIMKSSLQISLVTYLMWIVFVKNLYINNISTIFLIFSFVMLFLFVNIFISQTQLSKTEEIIETFKDNKEILSVVLMYCLFTFLSVL